MQNMFCIILFKDDNTIDYIPEEWLVGRDQCYYPTKNVAVLKKKSAKPSSDWRMYSVRILSFAGVFTFLFTILYFLIAMDNSF